jgi:L-2-hydroxyglutarate oxidase LhgO
LAKDASKLGGMTVLVVGAGVVGLAAARAIARRGATVMVAEKAGSIGSGISSRNSEVMHAGMYYPTGSLRARHCVDGQRRLYAYCESHHIPHRKCGKLIVALEPGEEARIEEIQRQGTINGVRGLELISRADAIRMEPNLSCAAALHSPETGVIDSHQYMVALQGDIEDAGGAIAFHSEVTGARRRGDGWEVSVNGADTLEVDALVNCAALGAQKVARATEGYPGERVPPLFLAKGNYFACSGKPAFTRLIYPAPVEHGLGRHLTLDIAGRMKFGPDVEWVEQEDYEVDPRREDLFYASVRRFWPGLPDGALRADYSGIRPKISGPGQPQQDFLIDGPAEHGLPGLVQMFGIESPGLTSSLSLGEAVADRLER